jgi:hypothetical protein
MIINVSLSGDGDEYKFELVQAIKKLRVAKVSDVVSESGSDFVFDIILLRI